MPRSSPRWQLVVERAADLLDIAKQFRAEGLALCGSVARGEDHDGSDIDLYVEAFALDDGGGPEDRRRADEFVVRVRAALQPFKVDVRPLPGWLLGADQQATMERDAIPLERIVEADRVLRS